MAQGANTKKVFRLRNLPGHVDRQAATELFASCFSGNFSIASLASSTDIWQRIPTKIATLTLDESLLTRQVSSGLGEWTFVIPGLPHPLILDHHFRGLTPFNEVDPGNHTLDCIAISGLSSHPLGSWQPHGGSKSFMWIRDELPQQFPNVRFITYGYDTLLAKSNSFQTIWDLANTLINVLRADGWSSSTAKRLVFLAHSLGGVIVKQALVMLAGSGHAEVHIASLVQGAMLFGVPSSGMAVDDVCAMLGNQPNKDALVKEISAESSFLAQLESQFWGISYVRNIKLCWVYETKTTGTLEIDENHSDMVKFTPGDHRTRIVANKLSDIFGLAKVSDRHKDQMIYDGEDIHDAPQGEGSSMVKVVSDSIANASFGPFTIPDPVWWDNDLFLRSLLDRDRDTRRDQIDPQSSHTLEWAFEDGFTDLPRWLQNGNGIFWVSGKPGSGKSTLMKFVHNDDRTRELLHCWNTSTRQITANFFFHYRGNVIQKSFEGLLRSIISQLLEAEPELYDAIHVLFNNKYNKQVHLERLGSLQSDLYNLANEAGLSVPNNTNLKHDVDGIIQNQDVSHTLKYLTSSINWKPGRIRSWNTKYEERLLQRGDELLDSPMGDLDLDRVRKALDVRIPAPDFDSLIMTWRERIDLGSNIRALFAKHPPSWLLSDHWNPEHSSVVHHSSGTSEVEERARKLEQARLRKLDDSINAVLIRHQRRKNIKAAIESTKWNRKDLEEILHSICAQSMFDLDLCLFLDALDEYDGRPEFISGFLKDLTRDGHFPRTRIRILFSSRPWKTFRDEFESCPGFKIHEHTQNDIRKYCMTSIYGRGQLSQYLLPYVDEIVHRSSGVFLWVKLVLHDLFQVVAQHGHGGQQLADQLRKTMDTLPDQLEAYYVVILERLSNATRWDAYVILESLVRSVTKLSATQLSDIVAYSSVRRWSDVRKVKPGLRDAQQASRFVQEACGGLVDVEAEHVQLMHQTVRDLVEAPGFRHVMFDASYAATTDENGFSFLAKYILLHPHCGIGGLFSFYARKAERTTGLSQHSFFLGVPPSFFQRHKMGDYVSSPLTLAAFAGLELFLEDAHRTESEAVGRSREWLLLSTDAGIGHGLEPDEALVIIRSLTAKGFAVDRDPAGLSSFVRQMWGVRHQRCVNNLGGLDRRFVDIVATLVDHLSNLEISIQWKDFDFEENNEDKDKTMMPLPDRNPFYDTHGYRTKGPTISGKILHLSPPSIAKILLERGADPNAADSLQRSPLDYLLFAGSLHSAKLYYINELQELLKSYGGRFRRTLETDGPALHD
ncbi:hypothetical protein JX265_005711 [Neoarthrinium moseri]|uniref:Nephrocystin 3-like N-terminal domain-containing protein n=1 Tax=Neoarthrinium moseri TaxID=1658444 RepID=A0A9Q0AQ65_9PEZI|nr:hypothetical protein JX265_005711 [Neoarthrinium moseri]